MPNTLDTELLPPATDVTIAREPGGRELEPRRAGAALPDRRPRAGIVLAGVRDSFVVRNRIVDHDIGA